MIPTKRHIYLFVYLTFTLLAACEPLAPQQENPQPQIIIVTGDAAAATPPVSGTETAVGLVNIGAVSTPIPSATFTPTITPTPTATPFVCPQTTGQMIEGSFDSPTTGGEGKYLMYLPPCFYETLQRYPTVILLHGTGYDETMWRDLDVADVMDQGIAKGTLPPMVLIMPNGGDISELNDQPDGQSYETVILDELLPTVESDFCLWGGRQGRAIGGISRGGFWAFSIVLRHPDLFNAVGGHSPYFAEDNAGPETNPLALAENVNLDKFSLRIAMDNGTDDMVGANVKLMSDTLSANGVENDYLINPAGGHDMDYWRSHIAEYLAFYGEAWPHDVMALPSCLEPSPQ